MLLEGFQTIVSAECREYADFLKNIEFKMTISDFYYNFTFDARYLFYDDKGGGYDKYYHM